MFKFHCQIVVVKIVVTIYVMKLSHGLQRFPCAWGIISSQKVELVCLLVRCDWFVTMLKHTVLSTWFMMARNSASESRRPCSVTYSSLEASGDASLSASLLEVSFFGVGWSRNEMRWKGDQVSWLWSDRKTAVAGTCGGSGLCWCLNLQVIHSAVRSFIIHTPFYQNSKSDLQ